MAKWEVIPKGWNRVKETKSVEFQEWNIRFLRILWFVTGLAFVVALVLYAMFDDVEHCSKQVYFMTFVAVPTLMQVIICVFMELFVRKISNYVPNRITALFMAICMEILCGILVMVHTSVGEMAIVLVVPLVLASVYNNRFILIVQAVLACIIYVVTQLVIIPNAVYIPKNDATIYIIIFVGLTIAVSAWVDMMIRWHIEVSDEMEKYREREVERQKQLMTDSLTGLWNHKAFVETLRERMGQLKQQPGQCILILLDIDGLYQINERYGYISGDKIIMKLTEIVKKNVRSHDYVARYNGEEFVIILNDVAMEVGQKIASRIQQQFAEYIFEECDNGQYTVSIGIAQWHDSYNSNLDFVSKVELALRSAKLQGYGVIQVYNGQNE